MSIKIRIALYARVSTKDKGQDVENQLGELKDFVNRKVGEGWEVVKQYTDYASGKTSDREEFTKLFTDAAQNKFDMVVFWSLDRFSREGVGETLNLLQRLTSYGVDWWSYKEEYLRSVGIFRDAVIAILATIAKQERIRMSERVTAGLSKAKSKGVKLGRPVAKVREVRVLELKKLGLSIPKISEHTGVSISTVNRILARSGNLKDVKSIAYGIYGRAIKCGVLIKPNTCSKCGKVAKIHGHHTDYNKPLDVIWLCPKCHRVEHGNVGHSFVTLEIENIKE